MFLVSAVLKFVLNLAFKSDFWIGPFGGLVFPDYVQNIVCERSSDIQNN